MSQRIPKPWGEEILFAHTEHYAGKLLKINKGESLSLQYHRKKDETIYVYEGSLKLILEVDGRLTEILLGPGDTRHLPPGTRHRMEAITDCILFEVSTPELDDVVRLQDRYGRA
jgi:quercetin dioxygenase-like cupin family protein